MLPKNKHKQTRTIYINKNKSKKHHVEQQARHKGVYTG